MVDQTKVNVSLTAQETTQLITEPLFFDEMVARDYRIQTGILKDKENNVIKFHRRNDPLRKVTGCDLPKAAPRESSDRKMMGVSAGYQDDFCAEVFNQLVEAMLLRNNLRRNDITDNNQIGALFAQMAIAESKAHLFKLSWFGDKNSTDPAYNILNGYWALIDEAVGQNLTPRIATYSNAVLSSGQGITILRNVVENADNVLKGMAVSDKAIYVDGNVYERLVADIEAGIYGDGTYKMAIIDGMQVPTYRGIELRVMWEWADLATDLKGYTSNANLVCYTAKQNLVWGINESDVTFEMFFGRESNRTILRNMFTFGCQIDEPQLMSVAY